MSPLKLWLYAVISFTMIKHPADARIEEGLMGKSGEGAPKLILVDSTDQRLARDLRSSRLVMIVFHQLECPHCLNFFGLLPACAPDMEGMLKVIRCEVGNCILSSAYNKVRVSPTSLLVRDGIVVNRMEGEMTKADLLSHINKASAAK